MSRQDLLEIFHSRTPAIAPSMLGCDFGNLHREAELLEAADAPLLHLDVMDGHFVPNLTYGPRVIAGLRRTTQLPLDAHLMINHPEKSIEAYLASGCDGITVHVEAFEDTAVLCETLDAIREGDAASGIAISPTTPVEHLEVAWEHADQVLVMSVEPGFGGQSFLPESLSRLEQLQTRLPDHVSLAVDGGIGLSTITAAYDAGARVFVAGSAIFGHGDYREAIQQLTQAATPSGAVQEA